MNTPDWYVVPASIASVAALSVIILIVVGAW